MVIAVGFLLRRAVYSRVFAPKDPDNLPEETPAEAEDPDTGDRGGPSDVLTEEQLALLKPNELGKVPIIMYHAIGDTEGEWQRSRANFRADLQRFYDLGYSLIPLNDYLTGQISAPAGRAPLVLTFDDATAGQFTMIESEADGKWIPDPDSAVGMLLEFEKSHPEFGHAATFFIDFPAPFGDAKRVKENLAFLVENGMEIGNHTYNHRNLQSASPDLVVQEIGSLANKVWELCGYEPLSLALPYGGYPKSEDGLASGEWEGRTYANLGVLLVGAEPAPSPFSSKFSPLAIPRIRGSQEELDKWLGNFERYPEGRFVSDGQASKVTIREGEEGNLDPTRIEGLEVVTYTLSPTNR
ncbi:MAG TPA: polysaccharide deacetylase family protein [Firmicutes bacterium]|nr:polysaccharide deacetylase family protein [Candidatus Fermentithermobacillaceae bacterium]